MITKEQHEALLTVGRAAGKYEAAVEHNAWVQDRISNAMRDVDMARRALNKWADNPTGKEHYEVLKANEEAATNRLERARIMGRNAADALHRTRALRGEASARLVAMRWWEWVDVRPSTDPTLDTVS